MEQLLLGDIRDRQVCFAHYLQLSVQHGVTVSNAGLWHPVVLVRVKHDA